MATSGNILAPVDTGEAAHHPAVEKASETELQRFLRYATEVERGRPLTLRAWLNLAESWRITRTLRECGGNRSAAARALGIGRRTLYAKMDKLGIAPRWAVEPKDPPAF